MLLNFGSHAKSCYRHLCAGVSLDGHSQLLRVNTRAEFAMSYGNMICKTQVKPLNTVFMNTEFMKYMNTEFMFTDSTSVDSTNYGSKIFEKRNSRKAIPESKI